MKAYVCRALLLASVCLLLPSFTFAQNTIHVPADVPDIQSAIFAAQNGDTVVVSPGYYFASINFQGKNITVMSSDGAAVTTVDSGSQPTAQFFNAESNGAVLHGFTFVNGAGIQIFSASPIIEDNVITGNQGCQAGGILLENSSAIIRRNTITNNTQFCSGGATAGGIAVDGVGSVQILNNTISGNQAAPGTPAGGIFTDAFGTTTINNNKIQNNVTNASGGGIYADGSNVIIAGNLITGNSASMGGGIQIVPGSSASLVNNTVALNLAQQGSQLQLDGSAGQVNLFNNIFYDLTGNGAIFCTMTEFTGFPAALNNDAVSFDLAHSGAPRSAYAGSCSDQTGSNGNVQVDPQFIDSANGDFHLSPGSPLIDTGNNFALNLPAQDLDGNPRIAAGSSACLPLIDIGAYELVFNSVGSASLSPASLSFGQAPIGVQSFFTQPVTVTGTGGCAQITSITAGTDYQQTNNCSALPPGASCTIQVTFAPTLAGVRNGALKVNMLSPAATITAELSGVGQNSASVTPAELKFGIQAIQTSQFQSVNISSILGQPLQVSRVSITGDFQQFSNCSQPGSNACFITVEFTPTAAGPRTGVLTVVSNLGTYTVPLSGDGAAPVPSLSPASLSFPTQTAGVASAPQPVTLTNNGTTDLVWNSVFSTPDFQVTTPPSCNGFLPAGTSCTFNVAFKPTTLGPITGSMEIDTNGGPVTASLTGVGTVPIVSLSPQVLNFANQPLNTSSPSQAITVTNISGIPLQLMSLTAPDNFLATSTCPAVLDVNASCEIDVLFDPVSSGPYTGFVTLGTVAGQVTAALTVGSNHVFHVPSEVPSIFQAVQLAQDGDTVLVAPGTYFEQVSFQGKAITIASTAGAAVTTLDGQGFQIPVMSFQNEGPASVLKGFTITHSSNSGIQLFGSSPTIQDNIITENSGCNGAGLQLQGSSAVVEGNTISNNTIANCSGDGAGIWISNSRNVQVIDNLITGNQNTSGGFGGGIAVSGINDTITIISNTIRGNSDNFSSGGGVALINGGDATLIQNLITGNSTANSGGGVYASPRAQLINNTIADNFAPNGSGLLLTGADGGAAFANNIITDSSGSSALSCDSSFFFAFLPGIFEFNDVFSSAGGAPFGNCQDLTSITGNISQDPQFVSSASGDYRLQSSSPAVDKGTDFFGNPPAPLPDRDLAGNGRILPGNATTCTGTIDLGAYEFAAGANGTPGPLPASWDFGSAEVGFQGPQFVFNQSAQGCVAIASIKTTGDFQQTNTCNNAVSNFISCSISVSFNPQHLGPRTGSLIVDYGSSSPPVTVALTGQGIDNPPLASPASLSFDAQAVGTSSAAQQISIVPNSQGAFTVNAIWITGDFSQTNQCAPSTQPPTTGACLINVVFTPTASGNGQGTLTVSTNQGVVVVPLIGTVNSVAIASLSPSSLSFGSQQVGTVSTGVAITLSNTGGAPLSYGIGLGPDFTATNACPQPLPAGSSCSFSVFFRPTIPGPVSELLTLTGNSNPPAAPVTLTGTGLGPLPSFSPTSLTFAAQLDGTTSAAQTVFLSNTGNAPLAITGFVMNGNFSERDGCGTSLAAGASCPVSVVFSPTSDGTQHGSVTLVSNFNGLPAVNLTGTGQAVQASVSPSSLTFPTVFLGSTSAAQSVTYTNTGSLPISITAVSATGDFAQTNTCGTTLAVGSTCTASVTFTPTARGTRTGTLSIFGNFTGNPPVVNLTGTGQVIQATVSPTTLTFADQQVGTTSARQSITLTNSGDASLTISSVTATGDFLASNGCGAPIPVGGSCQVSVTFAPTVLGTRTGSVIINSNSTTQIAPIMVTGNGIGPNPVFSVSSLTFGPQFVGTTSAPQSVTLTNSGTMAFTNVIFSLGGDYTETNNCGTSLAIGASCTINVSFRPSAAGTRQSNMVVTGNLFGSPGPSVNLSGTGETLQVTASPVSLAFAPALLGSTSASQAVTFTNSGDLAVAINAITITGDFAQTNTCGASLPAGVSCTVNVTFTPTVRGTRTGTLSFTSSAPGTPPVVTLSGTGQAFVASISPTSFDFGNEPVNTTTNSQIFTYKNTGDLALTISSIAVPPDFNQTNTCPATLAVGASCNINVSFVPRSVGTQTASLTVSADTNISASVTGNGVMPTASLSPASLNFGHQRVGTASAPQLVTVTNTGAFAFFINGLSYPGPYQVTNNCTQLVNPGTSCTVSVVFAPTNVQSGVGSLTITGDFTATPSSVSLSGTPDASTGVFSPTALTFANQVVGTTSSSQTVTLISNGTVPINLSSIQTTGDFSQTNNCGTSLPVGTNCTITVAFTPTAHGLRSGTLTVSGDFTGTAPSVALSGNGTTPTASWSPASLTFANQLVAATSSAQPVTLTNSGDGPLTISGITATGDFAQTNTCGSTLAAGGSCTINVTFTASTTGSRSGTLSLNSNSSAAVSPITLAGTGVAPAAVLSTASLSFANQVVSTPSVAQAATLTNNGTAALTISSISVTGDFGQTNNCGSSLAVAANCTINITFTPSAPGSRAGSLSIIDNSLDSNVQTVSLSGFGIDFSLSGSPSSVTINSGQIASYTITVSSLGSAFNSSVALSCTGLPGASSCSFSPATVTPGSTSANSTLQVTTTKRRSQTGTPAGTYNITVTGTSGSVQRSATIHLTVN